MEIYNVTALGYNAKDHFDLTIGTVLNNGRLASFSNFIKKTNKNKDFESPVSSLVCSSGNYVDI